MPLTLDIFHDDAFSLTALAASINQTLEGQQIPGIIDDLFDESGIATSTMMIERQGEVLSMVPVQPRGAPGSVTVGAKRDAIPFSCVHLPTVGTIMADEVQGVRAFGTTSELQTLQSMVTAKLRKMRKRIDATLAYHRIGTVKGLILDADGTRPVLDVFSAFGVEQQVHGMHLNSSATKVRIQALEAKRKSEDVLGGSAMVTGWRAICGRAFFDALIAHADVEKAYERWQGGEALRNDPRTGFRFADINWREYYGQVNGIAFIAPDEAYLIPEGVDELFITRFGPADYMETVNTLGLPYYASQERMDHNKGINLEAQSNPLNLCTQPRAIIKLTMGNTGASATKGPSGMLSQGSAKTPSDDSPEEPQLSPAEQAEKLVSLLNGIDILVANRNKGDTSGFTRSGEPTVSALNPLVKWDINGYDRDVAWTVYQATASNDADDNPSADNNTTGDDNGPSVNNAAGG